MEFIKNKILVVLCLIGGLGIVKMFFAEVPNQYLINVFFACFFIANELYYVDLHRAQTKTQRELIELQDKVADFQGNSDKFKELIQTEMQANLKAHITTKKSLLQLNEMIQNILKLL